MQIPHDCAAVGATPASVLSDYWLPCQSQRHDAGGQPLEYCEGDTDVTDAMACQACWVHKRCINAEDFID